MNKTGDNVRFWVYANGGPVKITLRPGQQLTHSVGWLHEEGWSRETVSWHYADDEPVVYREWIDEGADCDGRHSQSGEDQCHVAALATGNEPYVPETASAEERDAWDGVIWPAWEKCGLRQYDQFAEMAGY